MKVFAALLASLLTAIGGSHAFVTPSTCRYKISTSLNALKRRNFLKSAAFTTSGILWSNSPATAATQARVEQHPPLEYLEPIYELKLSLNALQNRVADETTWPLLQKRLDGFFKGGLLSEKFYYVGLSFQYVSKIKYDKNDLQEYIRLDKEARVDAMDDALNNMEALKNDLGGTDKKAVEGDIEAAQAALNRWFSMVPQKDIEAVDTLFRATRVADVNRDGKLDAQELETLSEQDRDVWKKRVALVGDR